MGKLGEIRVLALGLIQHGDRLFLSQGYDRCKQETFYRALGGGINFGETSLEALQREFQEEIQAQLTNIHYLGCLENIFVYNGEPGHEIIQLYRCDFADRRFYQVEKIVFAEGERQKTALWVDKNRFQGGQLKLVPQQMFEFLHNE